MQESHEAGKKAREQVAPGPAQPAR